MQNFFQLSTRTARQNQHCMATCGLWAVYINFCFAGVWLRGKSHRTPPKGQRKALVKGQVLQRTSTLGCVRACEWGSGELLEIKTKMQMEVCFFWSKEEKQHRSSTRSHITASELASHEGSCTGGLWLTGNLSAAFVIWKWMSETPQMLVLRVFWSYMNVWLQLSSTLCLFICS